MWVSSFIISAVLLTPVLRGVGIGLGSVDFQLSFFALLTVVLTTTSGFIHIGFRLDGIPSRPADTFLLYALAIGSYSPLFNLLSYPSLSLLVYSMKSARAHSLGFLGSLVASWRAMATPEPFAGALIQVSTALLLPVTLAITGVFAEAIARYYKVDRRKVLSSISFSVAILAFLPLSAIGVITWLFYASFVAQR
jgi:hypothetical protein